MQSEELPWRDVHPHVLVDDLHAGLLEEALSLRRIGLEALGQRQRVEAGERREERMTADRKVPGDAEAVRGGRVLRCSLRHRSPPRAADG
jgi:hypothetical protein